jgi:hypothetical protein
MWDDDKCPMEVKEESNLTKQQDFHVILL